MCGIAGALVQGDRSLESRQISLVERMAESLAHRGPDDTGTWISDDGSVAFGFRRLAIIDTSEAGHQPMQSASRRYTIVFNGEIYNYVELRDELRRLGHEFHGESDTEVLLAAFEQWGVRPALPRLLGMFAMAVHDQRDEETTLVRDQLGIKPLYYHQRSGFITFASQSRALRQDAEFPTAVDRAAAGEYLRSLTIPTPRSVYSAARRLPPGHCLTIRSRDLSVELQAYSTPETTYRGRSVLKLDDEALIEQAQSVLSEAVGRQLRSDVPLGAFLSGGIDSSLVTALAQEHCSRPLRTYSIGFAEAEFDESAFAAEVASILGTQHTEIQLTHAEALAIIPEMPRVFDEPFASPSAIPNYLLCRDSRRDVTVALSGTGGDELFIGYNRYLAASVVLPAFSTLPHPVRRGLAALLRTTNGLAVEPFVKLLNRLLPGPLQVRRSAEKLDKLQRLLLRRSAADMYHELLSTSGLTSTMGAHGESLSTAAVAVLADESIKLRERVVLADQLGYLVDDQLTKVDTVSMAVGLEVRVPLLDQALVEFSWNLPYSAKVRRGRGKWILREVLSRYIPRELIARPKQGLSLPIASWLRRPLREWAEDLLFSDVDVGVSLYTTEDLKGIWRRFLDGEDDLALTIWAVAMLHQWELSWGRDSG